jgi:Flp pilus assembly protein TadB
MSSNRDREEQLKRRELELQERERQIRLRELEAEIYQEQPPLHQTTKHQPPQKPQKSWLRKLVNVGKFFALVVVVILSIRVALWLAYALMVLGIAFIAYKLFFDGNRD